MTTFETRALAMADHPATAPNLIRLEGYAAAGDLGAALYKKVASSPGHNGKFSITLADGITVVWYEIAEPVLNAKMFGAVGDNTIDDTTALQSAINCGIAQRLPLFLNPGVYLTTGKLECHGNLRMYGAGYQADRGAVYDAEFKYGGQPNIDYASVIRPGGEKNFTALEVKAFGSVNFENFEINFDFPENATIPSTCIGIKTIAPASTIPDETSPAKAIHHDETGTYSKFNNVAVSRAYYGWHVVDQYDFKMSGCGAFGCAAWGMVFDQTVYKSYSDSTIEACAIFNNVLGGILIRSGGGYRIENNKINYGDPSTSIGVLVQPDLTVGAQIEPLVIVGNSFEGTNQGIVFARKSGSDTLISQVVVASNQIWVGGACIASVSPGSSWIGALTITANTLVSGVNAATNVNIAGVDGLTIVGNNFATSQATTNAVAVGANCANYRQASNVARAGTNLSNVSTPTIASSTTAMTNSYPHAVVVSLYGGTISGVIVDGATVGVGAGQYIVEPTKTIAVTYSVAPNMHWRALNP